MSLILFLGACKMGDHPESNNASKKQEKVEVTMQGHYPMWSKNANMYEVNIRQFTPEGTFKAFESHIPRLKDMGIDILWLMPIYPISETKKKGSLGSYYAVSDFSKVNPEFGTLEEFRSLVKTVHSAGMKMILDFVPNHTGWDHVWITEHPDYYTKDADGNIVDPIDPSTGKSWGWTDVADLNFANATMRKSMIDDMLYWLEEESLDGYRMDVAHGVPVEFWNEVSTALTASKPDVFMLAESEVPALRNQKYFQTDYGWEFHHLLNALAKGEKAPKDIEAWYNKNQGQYQEGWHIQFTSNHDENSWAGTTKERMAEAHDALAILAYTIEGMPLIYGGQEEPLDKRLEFFEKDDIGFDDYTKAEWFKTILELKHENPAIWNGEFGGGLTFDHIDDQVIAYSRTKGNAEVLVVLNLSDKIANYESQNNLEGYTDLYGGSKMNLVAGAKMKLKPWGYKVLSKM